jgi:hypothetical protein
MASPSVPHATLDGQLDRQSEPQLATLGWALRRAALGMAILLTVALASALLLYASLEPDGSTAGVGSQGGYAIPPG